jgi:hypothetical protein
MKIDQYQVDEWYSSGIKKIFEKDAAVCRFLFCALPYRNLFWRN